MANSFVLFLSAIAPNFIARTSLVTVLLARFFLFFGYFILKDSLPKFWLFMHYLLMYKYALDALLINEYSCLVSMCLIWFDDEKKTCMVNGGDVMEKRGLHERLRWINVYVMNGCFEVVWHCPQFVKKKLPYGVHSVSVRVESILDVKQVDASNTKVHLLRCSSFSPQLFDQIQCLLRRLRCSRVRRRVGLLQIRRCFHQGRRC